MRYLRHPHSHTTLLQTYRNSGQRYFPAIAAARRYDLVYLIKPTETSLHIPKGDALCLFAILCRFTLIRVSMSAAALSGVAVRRDLYRADGVRITHDPFEPGMAEKYGLPGKTDNEGFDPYADSVGPGIYGGIVKRDDNGQVVVGSQYQNHNPHPGPVYAGGGYTPMSNALGSGAKVAVLLDRYPDLTNDVSTGGAQPLHMCGMSQSNQHSAALLISCGSSCEAPAPCPSCLPPPVAREPAWPQTD